MNTNAIEELRTLTGAALHTAAEALRAEIDRSVRDAQDAQRQADARRAAEQQAKEYAAQELSNAQQLRSRLQDVADNIATALGHPPTTEDLLLLIVALAEALPIDVGKGIAWRPVNRLVRTAQGLGLAEE